MRRTASAASGDSPASAKTKNLPRLCAQYAASVIGPGCRLASYRSPTPARRAVPRARHHALGRCNQHSGKPTHRSLQLSPPAIDLFWANLGTTGHLVDHGPRRQTLSDDRSLLILGPTSPTLWTSNYLYSPHRTVSCTGASTGACTGTYPARSALRLQDGPRRRNTVERILRLFQTQTGFLAQATVELPKALESSPLAGALMATRMSELRTFTLGNHYLTAKKSV
jgi:hypothetical protein